MRKSTLSQDYSFAAFKQKRRPEVAYAVSLAHPELAAQAAQQLTEDKLAKYYIDAMSMDVHQNWQKRKILTFAVGATIGLALFAGQLGLPLYWGLAPLVPVIAAILVLKQMAKPREEERLQQLLGKRPDEAPGREKVFSLADERRRADEQCMRESIRPATRSEPSTRLAGYLPE